MNDAEFNAALAAENKNAPAFSLGFDNAAKPGRCNVIFPDTKESCGSPAAFCGVGDCSHFRVCFQCARPYAKGGRPLEALERVEMPPPQNTGAMRMRLTWRQWLGVKLFPSRYVETPPLDQFDPIIDDDPAEPEGDVLVCQIKIQVSWLDLLRLLFTRRAVATFKLATKRSMRDHKINTGFHVAPPKCLALERWEL
jgi:hypothetical protein